MGFVSMQATDVMTFKEAGQELVGYYTGTQKNQGQDNNSCIHSIEKEDGSTVQFWGSFVCDEQMEKLTLGVMTKIVYKGMQQPKTASGRPYKNWEIFADNENMKQMPQAAPTMDSPVANDDFPAAGF